MTRREWLQEQVPIAKRTNKHWQVSIAVAIYESGWGQSHLAKVHNNLHGITMAKDPSTYRHFPNTASSYRRFNQLLTKSSVYQHVRDVIETYKDDLPGGELDRVIVAAMAPIYCPDDPDWARDVLICLRQVQTFLSEEDGHGNI